MRIRRKNRKRHSGRALKKVRKHTGVSKTHIMPKEGDFWSNTWILIDLSCYNFYKKLSHNQIEDSPSPAPKSLTTRGGGYREQTAESRGDAKASRL